MPTEDLPGDFYDRIKPRLHRRIARELRAARRVLDLGCGSCDLVRQLAETPGREVIGVDLSSVEFPRTRRTPGGARFRCLTGKEKRIVSVANASVDAVVTMWALHEMAYPRDMLREVGRVLRPGGEALVVDFPRDSLAQRIWNEDYYRPPEIGRLLSEAGFARVRVQLIEKDQIAWVRGWKPLGGVASS